MADKHDPERIFIYTGPDGSGRKTVADLVGVTFGLRKVISYSTRKKRPGEVDGQDYHFITHEQFERDRQMDQFLESVQIHNHWYGVKHKDVTFEFIDHRRIYVIVNKEGAEILKRWYGDSAVRFFIYADRQTLEARQREKGLPEETIRDNIARYDEDMQYMSQCEHAFENFELAHTVFAISEIMEGYLNRDLIETD